LIEEIHACGHHNVLARHKTTLEITKENYLTKKGDCIIAINADKGMNDLSDEFKKKLKNKTKIKIIIRCEGIEDIVEAEGSPDLILDHKTDMVIRKSEYICPRTLAIKANKSASDLSRDLISKVREGHKVKVEYII